MSKILATVDKSRNGECHIIVLSAFADVAEKSGDLPPHNDNSTHRPRSAFPSERGFFYIPGECQRQSILGELHSMSAKPEMH